MCLAGIPRRSFSFALAAQSVTAASRMNAGSRRMERGARARAHLVGWEPLHEQIQAEVHSGAHPASLNPFLWDGRGVCGVGLLADPVCS